MHSFHYCSLAYTVQLSLVFLLARSKQSAWMAK